MAEGSSDMTTVVSLVTVERLKLLSVQGKLAAAFLRADHDHPNSLVRPSYEIQKIHN